MDSRPSWCISLRLSLFPHLAPFLLWLLMIFLFQGLTWASSSWIQDLTLALTLQVFVLAFFPIWFICKQALQHENSCLQQKGFSNGHKTRHEMMNCIWIKQAATIANFWQPEIQGLLNFFWSIYCILSRKGMPAGRHESLNVSVPYVGLLASFAKADQKALGLQIQKGKWYP